MSILLVACYTLGTLIFRQAANYQRTFKTQTVYPHFIRHFCLINVNKASSLVFHAVHEPLQKLTDFINHTSVYDTADTDSPCSDLGRRTCACGLICAILQGVLTLQSIQHTFDTMTSHHQITLTLYRIRKTCSKTVGPLESSSK